MNKKKYTVDEFGRVVDGALRGEEKHKVKLVEMLDPLIKSSIKKFYYGDMDRDDLVSEGKMKVLECLVTFDKEKGVYFLGYVKAQLRYLYLNLSKGNEFEVSLNSTIDLGGGKMELMDTLVDESVDVEGDFVKSCEFENLKEALDNLTDREVQVLKMYYFENMGMKDIARELGLAYRTVVNTKVNGVEKLRTMVKR
ncbi:MAG: sigma-70 family RNA polymerase sigma factor [Tissierellales bacterium]|nr:sigma-70 family RNA polymerase sigma factor [Tissierellales bacterium]